MASFWRNRYLDCRSVAAVVLGSMAILRSYGRTWRDRVVVVTGGTSGIGREFALRLAAEGAKVIACARKEVTLRELHTRFPQIEAIRCDVTVTPDVLALEAAIQDRYGRVDVLINNAGIMERVDLLDRSVSDERIAQEIAVNLTGPILLTRRPPTPGLWPKPDDHHGHLGVRPAPGNPGSDLFRDQGRTPFLYDGASAAVAVARRWHSRRRSTPTPGRYAGHALCTTAEDVAGNAGRPGVARY